MSKYDVPDDYWEEREERQKDPETGSRTSVQSFEVEVIYTVDPDEDMGYGREKYTARLTHDGEDGLRALYVVEHKWKGNYWRDTRRWDWRDVPAPVRRQVADVVHCGHVGDLDPGVRLIDEGGESTWRRESDVE